MPTAASLMIKAILHNKYFLFLGVYFVYTQFLYLYLLSLKNSTTNTKYYHEFLIENIMKIAF